MTARPWWREPALHFVLLGAAVFAVDAWRHPRVSTRDVEVPASLVRGLRDEHQRRFGRAPTRDELRAEVDRFVREEVLYREALAMGLDRGDVIIRRRLVQKLEFLLEDVAPPPAPTEAALRAWLDAHAATYAAPARLSLAHVFFDPGRRGERATREAEAALGALRAGADPATLGDPFVSATTYGDADRARVAADLGDDFVTALDALPTGSWEGPVRSRYGLHLVRVSARAPGRARPLEEVRERVARDWADDARARANADAWRRVAERYRVRVAWPSGIP